MKKMNIEGGKYRVLIGRERLSLELDKEKTDQAVSNLISVFSQVCEKLRESDFNYLDIISRMMEDYNERVDLFSTFAALRALESLQADLAKKNEEVPAVDDLRYLEDEGFKQKMSDSNRWEKILEDTDGETVVEEVFLRGGNEALHRKITYTYDYWDGHKNPEAEGFKQDDDDGNLWEKTIEDLDGKRVVEIVYFLGSDQVLHQKKTYENMPIDEHLGIVVQNTWEREYDDYDEWW